MLELAIGLAIGLLVGRVGAYALKRVALPASGLYPIAVMALCVLAYAGGALAHGTGFLAVYVAALILGNAKLPHRPAVRGFADGLAWIAQIGLFVLLGLLVTPHDLARRLRGRARHRAASLTLVARPLSVLVEPAAVPAALAGAGAAVLGGPARRGADRAGDHPAGGRRRRAAAGSSTSSSCW